MKKMNEILNEARAGALEKKGRDIVILDVRKLSDITDYYMIVTAQNDRQVKAVKDEIAYRLKKEFDRKPRHVEGTPSSQWIVMDYFDLIVHIFEENLRKYYELERLWGDAKIKKI